MSKPRFIKPAWAISLVQSTLLMSKLGSSRYCPNTLLPVRIAVRPPRLEVYPKARLAVSPKPPSIIPRNLSFDTPKTPITAPVAAPLAMAVAALLKSTSPVWYACPTMLPNPSRVPKFTASLAVRSAHFMPVCWAARVAIALAAASLSPLAISRLVAPFNRAFPATPPTAPVTAITGRSVATEAAIAPISSPALGWYCCNPPDSI